MKKEEVNKLIKASLKTDEKGLASARTLLSLGVSVVPHIVDAIQKFDSFQNLGYLPKILRQIEEPEMVDILLELLNNDNFELQMTAFRLLPRFEDKRIFFALIDFLNNMENLETARGLAAESLGELQNEKAISFLIQTVDQTDDNELKLSAISSLAKLGNNEKSDIALRLALNKRNSTIRPKATKTLQYIIVESLFETLKKTIRDRYVEMRLNSINALFYLGLKEVVPVLIESVGDKDLMVATMSLKRIEDLTGAMFQDEIELSKLEKWWSNEGVKYKENICYRLGEPIGIEKIIEALQEVNSQNLIIEELKIITGIDFSSEKFTQKEREQEQSAKIKQWLKNGEVEQFEKGALYKYGRKHDCKMVL